MSVDLSRFNRLPSLPMVAVRLLEQFADPNVALSQVVEVVQSDPAICTKLLKAASSSQFGSGKSVTDLSRAVGLLGRKQVTSLALCFSLSEDSMRHGPVATHFQAYWLKSVLQATMAGELARQFHRSLEGELLMAGLIADIGSLALLKSAPLEYAAAAERAASEENSELFEGASPELSLALLRHWKFPEALCAAMERRAWTIDQLNALPVGDDRTVSVAIAVAVAAGAYFCGPRQGMALARLTSLAGEIYEMSESQLQATLDTVQNRVHELSDLFKTNVAGLGSPAEIMSEAMEQLGRLVTAANDGSAEQVVREQLVDENGKLKQRIQDLVRRSSVDSLTAVFNRGHFDQELMSRFAEAQAARHPIGLLFIDADHFKSINDNYGHAAGDDVLRHTAAMISRSLRGGDLVARYGGEEFVVIVSNPSLAALEALGERIRAAVEQERIPTRGGVIRVTVSVGGALFEPPYSADACLELLHDADAAVYAAKAAGRNVVEIHRRIGSAPWSVSVRNRETNP